MTRHILVDGYNVLHATEYYRAEAETDLDVARTRLVCDVAAYMGPGDHAVVVFDGGTNPLSDGTAHDIAGVEVVFSAYGTDADSVIEDRVSLHRAAGDDVVLVTSDQTMQWTAMGPAVVRRSSAEFVRELGEEHAERAEFTRDPGRGTVRERVDAQTREALERWARGEAP